MDVSPVIAPFPIIKVVATNASYTISVSGTGYYIVNVTGEGDAPYDTATVSNILAAEAKLAEDTASYTNP